MVIPKFLLLADRGRCSLQEGLCDVELLSHCGEAAVNKAARPVRAHAD